jgi:hypothetical protein
MCVALPVCQYELQGTCLEDLGASRDLGLLTLQVPLTRCWTKPSFPNFQIMIIVPACFNLFVFYPLCPSLPLTVAASKAVSNCGSTGLSVELLMHFIPSRTHSTHIYTPLLTVCSSLLGPFIWAELETDILPRVLASGRCARRSFIAIHHVAQCTKKYEGHASCTYLPSALCWPPCLPGRACYLWPT